MFLLSTEPVAQTGRKGKGAWSRDGYKNPERHPDVAGNRRADAWGGRRSGAGAIAGPHADRTVVEGRLVGRAARAADALCGRRSAHVGGFVPPALRGALGRCERRERAGENDPGRPPAAAARAE